MSECDEVAAAMPLPRKGATLDEVRRTVRLQFEAGESETIIDNVAYSLWRRGQEAA